MQIASTKVVYLDQNAIIWLADKRLPKGKHNLSIEELESCLVEAVNGGFCITPRKGSIQDYAARVECLDMINCLRRINSQLTSLAYAIVRDSTRSSKTPVHSPEIEVEEAWLAEDSANKKQIGQ